MDFFYRRQKIILPIALFLVMTAVAFRFDKGSTEWLWNDLPWAALALVSAAVLLVYVWIGIERIKIRKSTEAIFHATVAAKPDTDMLDSLTERQREILSLIIKGKTNKEIMNELMIELSTLKTHINLMYRKLGIQSRKEARKLSKNGNSL